jgi:deoxyribonuclease V
MTHFTWPDTVDEALAEQERLRKLVVTTDTFTEIKTVAGIDAGYRPDPSGTWPNGIATAVVVVLDLATLKPLEYTTADHPAPLPYIPGLLSFREGPAVMAALARLRTPPDLLICDGQGIAHPRRLGIAAHIGALVDMPSIGCAKSILIGRHEPLPDIRGAHVPLTYRGEQLGVALRTRPGVKPVYISVGHRIGLESAIHYVMACTTKYRLPETTRAADGLASHGRIPQIEQG